MALTHNPFQCVVDANMSAQDVRQLLADAGIAEPSRMALYLWIRGANPSPRSMALVQPMLDAITKALEDKALPLPITVKRVERYKQLQNAVFPRLTSPN